MTLPTWTTPEGIIGTFAEGDPVLLNLVFDPGSGCTASVLINDLPTGITFSQTSSSTVMLSGSIGYVESTKTFSPTLRLQNQFGVHDRAFSIVVQNIVPTWTQSSNLGLYPSYGEVNTSLQLNDPGGSPTFTKISGNLPPGLALHSTGELTGVLEPVGTQTLYEFTVQAVSSITLQKTFQLTVSSVTGSLTPMFITSPGVIGDVLNGQPFSFQIQAVDLNNDPLMFSITGGTLVSGLTMNSSGLISGTCLEPLKTEVAFQVSVTDGSTVTVTRTFSIRVNQIQGSEIVPYLETTSGTVALTTGTNTLGTLSVGQVSAISLAATASRPVEFLLDSGSLPLGISLTEQGEFIGRVFFQTSGNYDFVVKIRNTLTETLVTCRITIVAGLQENTLVGYLNPTLQHKEQFRLTVTGSLLDNASVYRESDLLFGGKSDPVINLVFNNVNTKPELKALLSGREELTVRLSEFKMADAYQNDVLVYQVIYRELIDLVDTDRASVTIGSDTILPSSGSVLRSLLNQTVYGTEPLPIWMTSEQVLGDPTSVLGFTLAAEFCYLEPSEYNREILTELNNAAVLGEALYGTRLHFSDIRFDYLVKDAPGFTVRFHEFKS